jgi:hypothetical protein
LILVAAGVGLFLALSGEDQASAQTVTFEKPTESGADPFTKPADVRRKAKVDVGSGPFGGTGSDLVCDRELLIRSLRARPDRMREWARVLSVEPDIRSVARYIRSLRAVTLTRDTRVTNHSFVDGHAVAFQSILQAGTAVLVDQSGDPVARCRCGNPLLKAVYIETAKCLGCPVNYRPPRPCVYVDFSRLYRDYNGDEFLRVYRRRDFANACYVPYPEPPSVRSAKPRKPRTPSTSPTAAFSPSAGTTANTYTLSVSGFRPNVSLNVALTRPDGVRETYGIRTNAAGSGSHNFGRVSSNAVVGTYTATVTDPGTGDSANASARVSRATPQPDSGGLQCNPPRSQLEFERCRDQQGTSSPQPPPRDPNYDCPTQPPAHPGEDYLRNCPN